MLQAISIIGQTKILVFQSKDTHVLQLAFTKSYQLRIKLSADRDLV